MDLTIYEFTGEIQKRILDRLNMEYLSTGKYVKDQISVSPSILTSMMVAGGVAGTAISASLSSSLFMATANPATLMKIGSGVGSAIMGSSGIVGQAAFLPVASSIPVVAPLMAMQVISSVVMLQQFNSIDKKLNKIKGSIDKMIARQEVTKVAELLAAVAMVDEIFLQFGQTGYFSIDQLIRLALAERETMVLVRRYQMLKEPGVNNSSTNDYVNYDTYCTMLASFLNLRVKYLRTCVDVQENPQFIRHSSKNFETLLNHVISLWDELLHEADKIQEEIDRRKEKLNQLKNIDLINKNKLDNEIKNFERKYTAALEIENVIMKDFYSLMDIMKQMPETPSLQALPTLVYWRDNEGEHCIATNEQLLETVDNINAS